MYRTITSFTTRPLLTLHKRKRPIRKDGSSHYNVMPNFEIYNELQDLELLRWTRTLMSKAHSTHLINAVLSFAIFNDHLTNLRKISWFVMVTGELMKCLAKRKESGIQLIRETRINNFTRFPTPNAFLVFWLAHSIAVIRSYTKSHYMESNLIKCC